MNSYPKYSILTSVYKGEKFIKPYFKSVLEQDVKPYEIVLIDDGQNPKNFEEIIDKIKIEYSFDNILLIKNKKNVGPCISLNKGLTYCTTDLIFRLDFDDQWKKNHTKIFLDIQNKSPDYLIYGYNLKYTSIRNFLKCDKFYINENPLIHSSWLINKKLNKNFKYFLENPVIALEDWFTMVYYIKRGYRIFNLYDPCTVKYLVNPDSHGQNFKKNKKFIAYRKRIAISLYKYNFKKLNFTQILIKFGILNTLIFFFWTLDKFKIKK